MTDVRDGGCACGAVRYRLHADAMFVHCCHCLDCQRQTGSAFVVNLMIEAERVELLAGTPEVVPVPRGGRSPQRISRCPACQVAVYSAYTRPELLFVRGGTLDEPRTVVPDVHIYTRSKVGWLVPPAGARAFPAYYDTDAEWPSASLARLRAALAADDR